MYFFYLIYLFFIYLFIFILFIYLFLPGMLDPVCLWRGVSVSSAENFIPEC